MGFEPANSITIEQYGKSMLAHLKHWIHVDRFRCVFHTLHSWQGVSLCLLDTLWHVSFSVDTCDAGTGMVDVLYGCKNQNRIQCLSMYS